MKMNSFNSEQMTDLMIKMIFILTGLIWLVFIAIQPAVYAERYKQIEQIKQEIRQINDRLDSVYIMKYNNNKE